MVTSSKVRMEITQADMKAAVQYWLNNVVLKHKVEVLKVEKDRGAPSCGADHFAIEYQEPEGEGGRGEGVVALKRTMSVTIVGRTETNLDLVCDECGDVLMGVLVDDALFIEPCKECTKTPKEGGDDGK